jgi:aminoglycoside 3-N-acetyltransferase
MNKFEKTIANTEMPATMLSLSEQLHTLGVEEGMTIAMHSSFSSMGYVVGDAHSVIMSLKNVIGSGGTLAMPSHSFQLTEPYEWSRPAVPEEWHQTIIDNMPGYNKDIAVWRSMGKIPLSFHAYRDTLRSDHPNTSWIAAGKNAERIVNGHAMDFSQGEGSPLARLYDLDAYVMLVGVPYSNNTCFHLAESRADYPSKKTKTYRAPIEVNGAAEWISYDDDDWKDDDFNDIGAAAEKEGFIKSGLFGQAETRIFSFRQMVDFAAEWMESHRK